MEFQVDITTEKRKSTKDSSQSWRSCKHEESSLKKYAILHHLCTQPRWKIRTNLYLLLISSIGLIEILFTVRNLHWSTAHMFVESSELSCVAIVTKSQTRHDKISESHDLQQKKSAHSYHVRFRTLGINLKKNRISPLVETCRSTTMAWRQLWWRILKSNYDTSLARNIDITKTIQRTSS